MKNTSQIEERLANLGCWPGMRNGEWVIAFCEESYYHHGVSFRFENLGFDVWLASVWDIDDCSQQSIDSQQVIPAVERLIAERGTPITRDSVDACVNGNR